MSLSERFAKLASAKKTISSVVENRSVKRTTVITGQKVGRASAIQNKRGIEGSVKLTKPGAKSGKPLTKGKVVKIPGNGRKQGIIPHMNHGRKTSCIKNYQSDGLCGLIGLCKDIVQL